MRRCCSLNENGRRCRREAEYTTHYFGDSESNQSMETWMQVELCAEHAPDRARRILTKKAPTP